MNVHYTEMGSALALRGIGYLIANLLGVFLPIIVKKHNQGLLIVAFLLSGLSKKLNFEILFKKKTSRLGVLSIPFLRSLIVLCVVCFLLGIGHGLTDLGGTKLLFSMWGMNSAAPLNIVRLGYGIGAILMNLFVQPFLPQSNLFVPYLITAILCFAIAIGYLIFYVREVQYEIVNTNEQENEKTVRFGWILSVLFILSAFFTYGNEQTFSTFLFSYLKSDKFQISTNQAIASTIRYWLSYCLGRLLTAVVCVFLSVEICLTLVWILGFVLAVVWLVFVWFVGLTQTSLVLLGAATGFVLGPIIPLTFAFFNRKVNVTPILLALVLCGAALGIMSFQKIAGEFGILFRRNDNSFDF